MKKDFKGLVILFLMIVGSINVSAQSKRAGQITFIYPVGTAGTNATNYSNGFSFNIIGGINGGVHGFELGSVANINKGDVNGCQIAGVCNITSGDSKGFILSGVANLANNYSKGAMISGVVNYSGSSKGLQLSTVNIVKENFSGAQIGVVNIVNKANGLQFGVVNICNNSEDVIPFGVFNIVKNGYYAFELSTNETFLTTLSYKMGVEKFYTIFRGGIGTFNSKKNFSTGMGFGSIFSIKNNHKLNIELTCDELHYDYKWSGDKINLLNHLNLDYLYQINKHLGIKAGPSLNVYVTNQKIDGEFNAIDVPYTLFEHTGSKVQTSGWIGFNAGIVISL